MTDVFGFKGKYEYWKPSWKDIVTDPFQFFNYLQHDQKQLIIIIISFSPSYQLYNCYLPEDLCQ